MSRKFSRLALIVSIIIATAAALSISFASRIRYPSLAGVQSSDTYESSAALSDKPHSRPASSHSQTASESDAKDESVSEFEAQSSEEYATPSQSESLFSSESEITQYTQIKKINSKNEHLVYKSFYDLGIKCHIVYEENVHIPYGELISMDYSGSEDDNYYYVDPQTPVTLKISSFHGEKYMSSYIDRIFYLTFDDGPCANTEKIIRILEEYNIKATFFTVGNSILRFPREYSLIDSTGHRVACHSFSHNYTSIYSSADAFAHDIDEWEKLTVSILGRLPEAHIYRFPGGSRSSLLPTAMLADFKSILHSKDYLIFDWNLGNNDAYFGGMLEGQTLEEYLEHSFITTLNSTERANLYRICLLHETSDASVDMLRYIIEYVLQRGYVFRLVDSIGKNILF